MRTLFILILSLFFLQSAQAQRPRPKEKNGKWGLISAVQKGKKGVLVPYEYDHIGYFGKEHFLAKNGELWGCFDNKGNVFLPFEYGSITRTLDEEFIVEKDEKYGMMNAEKELLIPMKYEYLEKVDSHFIYAENGQYGLWDENYQTVIPAEYDKIWYGHPFLYILKKGGEYFTYKDGNKSPAQEEDLIFRMPDNLPHFNACDHLRNDEVMLKKCAEEKMLIHLYSNINYPALARENGIQGTVVIGFTVDKAGKLRDAKVEKSVGGGCDEESLRVISSMPNWVPGEVEGKVVTTRFYIPVRFRLE